MMGKKAIMVLGPPGSGKGTQAKLVAEKLGFFHFITSQVGKDYIATHNDSETQKQMEKYKAGILFDPSWLMKVLKEKTEEVLKNNKGIVYDGSPRTLPEAEFLYKLLSGIIGTGNISVIEIDVGDEELKKRLAKRLICSKSSNHVFIRSEKLNPGDSCPEGDGVLSERDLDKPELFDTRLAEYRNRTLPGLEFLKKTHLVITINGDQSIEEVQNDILEALQTCIIV
ncbi:MAG: nucleoside monophosphate kinase [bacterium]|nr:nucleoside monophosphate kinase [bacterium]